MVERGANFSIVLPALREAAFFCGRFFISLHLSNGQSDLDGPTHNHPVCPSHPLPHSILSPGVKLNVLVSETDRTLPRETDGLVMISKFSFSWACKGYSVGNILSDICKHFRQNAPQSSSTDKWHAY